MNNIEAKMIAPCGMNCMLCYANQRKERQCLGCNANAANVFSFCQKCIIRNCRTIEENFSNFCYECDKYPCKRLRQLDMRYRKKYEMSMIENLEFIKNAGIKAFLSSEDIKWRCESCGEILCVHRNKCLNCGQEIQKQPI